MFVPSAGIDPAIVLHAMEVTTITAVTEVSSVTRMGKEGEKWFNNI